MNPTIGDIATLWRRPSLKSLSCLYRYGAVCPARLGYAAAAELPSLPWQVVHDADFFSPAVASASAGVASSKASKAKTILIISFGSFRNGSDLVAAKDPVARMVGLLTMRVVRTHGV